jgi:predicted membrane protein
MVILSFLATMLWIAMLIGFLVAVFWVIVAVVLIRGYKRWIHEDDQIKQIEEKEEEDLMDESLERH